MLHASEKFYEEFLTREVLRRKFVSGEWVPPFLGPPRDHVVPRGRLVCALLNPSAPALKSCHLMYTDDVKLCQSQR